MIHKIQPKKITIEYDQSRPLDAIRYLQEDVKHNIIADFCANIPEPDENGVRVPPRGVLTEIANKYGYKLSSVTTLLMRYGYILRGYIPDTAPCFKQDKK